ncbi:MAG: TIGR02449 family protein [Pseudomonadales bacterium]|nr:TIGR02449 family protein [Pseudomonadales bacterium]
MSALILGGKSMENLDISELTTKVDALIKLCGRLSAENQEFEARQENWPIERARLIEQNNQAKQKIVQIISRLKSLEQAG